MTSSFTGERRRPTSSPSKSRKARPARTTRSQKHDTFVLDFAVAVHAAFQDYYRADRQNAKLEHDKELNRVVLELLSDHTELFKQFSDNPNFKRWLTDVVFDATYHPKRPSAPLQPETGAQLPNADVGAFLTFCLRG